MRGGFLAAAVLTTALAGCATYQPKPLDLHPKMLDTVPHLTIDTSRLPLPEMRTHRFDPADGLDMTDVAILAVVNNPDLKIARDDAKISYAQAFAAGLLPEPQLSSEVDVPGPRVPGSETRAFNFGLSWDIGSLRYHSRQRNAAELAAKQTDLNLLWQEWQVVAQARVLFAQNVADQDLLKLQTRGLGLLQSRFEHTQAALANGLTTADVAMTDLTALANLQSQIHTLELDLNAKHSQLAALLDLNPTVELNLVGPPQLPALDDAKVRRILPDLAKRRPDLLALQAGYESQDESYRVAILQQFPDITIGLNRQRDSSNVYSTGFVFNFALPINGNRGNIAVASATRQKLYDSFEARSRAADREISAVLRDEPLLQRQLAEGQRALAALQDAAANAQTAYEAGNLDELAFLSIQSGVLAKQVEIVNLRELILERHIALQTLIGSDLPVKTVAQD
ncbi:MAG: TolC family protein [Caldimonas sp.]